MKGPRWYSLAASRWMEWWQNNTPRRSRENIHHHYDLGNDFYNLWLDRQLIYTCAYFPREEMTLEQAQAAKMDHICRKMELRAGESVVEAGCGWERWRFIWRAITASASRHLTSRMSRSNTPGGGRARRISPGSSNLSKTIIAIFPANSTYSFRSACWSTWASRTTANSARPFTAPLETPGADFFTSSDAATRRNSAAGSAREFFPALTRPRCARRSRFSSRTATPCSTSKICAATTSGRSRTGWIVLNAPAARFAACTTSVSSAPGACTWPDRSRVSRPALFSFFKSSSPAPSAARWPGRAIICIENHAFPRCPDRRRRARGIGLRLAAAARRDHGGNSG